MHKNFEQHSFLRILSAAVVAVLVIAAVALVGVRLAGVNVYAVMSGSMASTYPTGSVIWEKEVDPGTVQKGDVVTFVLDEDLTVVTHRVVDVDRQAGEFTTKGDENELPDASPVRFENVIGVPVASLPYLGYGIDFIQHPPGTYLAIAAGSVLVFVVFLPEIGGAVRGRCTQGLRARSGGACGKEGEGGMGTAQGDSAR